MELPLSQKLRVNSLQRLFDNKSESYKLFWFRAIVDAVYRGKTLLSFEELIDAMIADAWYMVTEYNLNLGPADNLERLVLDAQKKSGLKSSEKKENVIAAIHDLKDGEIQKKKNVLILNVPYRLQAPFLSGMGDKWGKRPAELADHINAHEGLIYRFEKIDGLSSMIRIEEAWADYIKANYEIIYGWTEYNLIQYLQRRNPSVPGIPNKIEAPKARNLEKVKALWRAVMEVEPVREIYSAHVMERSNLSIDHFVPWSYVAHDELWNLSPTTRSINSKKSNGLPDWNTYFPELRELEYTAYYAAFTHEPVERLFRKCLDEHVNSLDVRHKLYEPGIPKEVFYRNLEEILHPVYTAAQNQGFQIWSLK